MTLNYIDLFAGAGGLSEGFIRAGFTPIAHVEMNKDACDTLRTRSAYHWLRENGKENEYIKYLKSEKRNKHEFWNRVPKNITDSVINTEISENTLQDIFEKIDKLLGKESIDIIIGGPPCQAYSIAGRARDPKGMKEDPRNYLYKYYVKFLERYKPKMFVFENVPGILSANNGVHLKDIFDAVKVAGYELKIPPEKYLNSKDFGVLQDRKRVIIIGWRKDLNIESYPVFETEDVKFEILSDLFADLKPLQNGEGSLDAMEYEKPATRYLIESGIRDELGFVTHHLARPNNERDLTIYRRAVDMWNKEKRRLNYGKDLEPELITHSNKNVFTNRFQVVNGQGISHTVVAHIAMDGHYYIHPDINQNRSISVREAARIQSFPDNYFFEGSRTSSFKQIGNAVPPLMAKKIADKLKTILVKDENV